MPPTPEQLALQAFSGRIGSNSLTAADQLLLTTALTSLIPQWAFSGSGPDPEGFVNFDESAAREWFATLYAIAKNSTGGPPVVPATWLVPLWFIDPVNGSDLNDGFTALTALKTWAQLVNLWGTNAPTLAQDTAIVFLTSQADNTDPVVFRPTLTKGASVEIVGNRTIVTAGVVLAGTVARDRATGVQLQTNLGATAAIGQIVENTTVGKESRAWIFFNVAGNVFGMTQPLAPVNGVPLAAPPAEVNTWANGDTVNLITLPAVHIVEVNPLIVDTTTPANNNGAFVRSIHIFLPPTDGVLSPCLLGAGASTWECLSDKLIEGGLTTQAAFTQTASAVGNCRNNAGVFGVWSGGLRAWIGGLSGQGAGQFVFEGDGILFDADHIFGVSAEILGTVDLGLVCVDLGQTLSLAGNASLTTFFYGASSLWGQGSLDVVFRGRLTYPAGAGAAVANLQISTMTLNGTTGHSVVTGAPDVFNGGIAVTAGALDAAAGAAGFGGNAFRPGGASISNTI